MARQIGRSASGSKPREAHVGILARARPQFWDSGERGSGILAHTINLRRLWKVTVLLMAVVSLTPLAVMTGIDYKVTQKSIESEILLVTSRVVSNTKRAVAFSLVERMSALDFIVRDNPHDALTDCARLATILDHLQTSFQGFVDLGVIDSSGRQRCYVGPYELSGVDYAEQEWFHRVVNQGMHVSDVFPGFRQVPHLVIAVKHGLPNGDFYVLRTSLEADFFNTLLTNLELGGKGDAFMINKAGILQTSSRSHGAILKAIDLQVPERSEETRVLEVRTPEGFPLIVGYAYIPETPFILMIVKEKAALMEAWRTTRHQLIGFLAVSITAILLVIFGVTTYLVNRIYQADLRRIATLHQVEYANKMASLGRVGAGVAHEINNPLAIINEKAGLIKDIFTYTDRYAHDAKLLGIADSILAAVERCATITHRLLAFARSSEAEMRSVSLPDVITEVLGFMGKEAEYRSITVKVDFEEGVTTIESNRGKLQQIFLNLINNAFAAVADGGVIAIRAQRDSNDRVAVEVTDTGCGMTELERARVFEPFFTTRSSQGGTGLGLSITHSLVSEIGGSIRVESEPGQGSTFTVVLPRGHTVREIQDDASAAR
jgi:two-component system NtrC family sensor kinase